MTKPIPNPRTPQVEVESMFLDRWSPRAFLPDPIPEHQLHSLFEAARWAPSCYNEQPWLFVYARTLRDRQRFAAALNDKNRSWAEQAPVLFFLLTRRHFASTAKPNRHALFDAGAAWMALALQARRLGLYAHGMGGFDQAKALEMLDIPGEEHEVIIAAAVGRRGNPEQLPPELAVREVPNSRKPLADVVMEGTGRPTI